MHSNHSRFTPGRQAGRSCSSIRTGKVLTLLALTILICPQSAQTAAEPEASRPVRPAAASQPIVAVPDDPLGRGTPRSATERFFGAAREGDFAQAAKYLDLAFLPESSRENEGPRLARQLWFVLERQTKVDLATLSRSPLGEQDDGLPPNRERLAQIHWARGLIDVNLERVTDPAGLEVWMVSSRTVEQIPKLFTGFRLTIAERFLSEKTVDALLRTHFLGFSVFTWMGLLWAVFVWAILVMCAAKVSKRLIDRLKPGTAANLLSMIYLPLLVLVITGLMRSAIPQRVFSAEIAWLLRGQTVIVVMVAWIFFRLVDFASNRARARLIERDGHTGFHLVDLLRRVAKVMVVVIALIVWLDNLGFKVTTIVASLGIIGLAVGLASQKFIEDLIAAMTLHATGVVKRNEAIRFGTQIGVVEDIGMRMITIRSKERTLITMPNASFAAMTIENFGRRDNCLFQRTLNLRYETSPDQLRYLLVEMRNLLHAHPKVDNERARVRFTGFGPHSLDVEVYCYINERNYGEYLAVAEDLNLRLMDIVAQAGTGFAFPSQTLYFQRGESLDKALAGKAEQQVRQWREQGQLFQHEFPDAPLLKPASPVKVPDHGSAGGKSVGI